MRKWDKWDSIRGKFLMQDTRQFCGNSMVFWAKDKAGYTCNVNEAHVFTREEARLVHRNRKSDKPWPMSVILESSTLQCDVQRLPKPKAGRSPSSA